MYSMEINKQLLKVLFAEAKENPRLRQNFDLRTSQTDYSFGSIFMPMNGHNCTRK